MNLGRYKHSNDDSTCSCFYSATNSQCGQVTLLLWTSVSSSVIKIGVWGLQTSFQTLENETPQSFSAGSYSLPLSVTYLEIYLQSTL